VTRGAVAGARAARSAAECEDGSAGRALAGAAVGEGDAAGVVDPAGGDPAAARSDATATVTARVCSTRAGELELATSDPEDPSRQLLPELPRAAQAERAGAGLGRPGGVRRRRLDAQGRSGGRVARLADLEVGGLQDLRRPRCAGGGVPHPAAGGPLSLPVAGREGRRSRATIIKSPDFTAGA
jgi:hypothetical protein